MGEKSSMGSTIALFTEPLHCFLTHPLFLAKLPSSVPSGWVDCMGLAYTLQAPGFGERGVPVTVGGQWSPRRYYSASQPLLKFPSLVPDPSDSYFCRSNWEPGTSLECPQPALPESLRLPTGTEIVTSQCYKPRSAQGLGPHWLPSHCHLQLSTFLPRATAGSVTVPAESLPVPRAHTKYRKPSTSFPSQKTVAQSQLPRKSPNPHASEGRSGYRAL